MYEINQIIEGLRSLDNHLNAIENRIFALESKENKNEDLKKKLKEILEENLKD